MPSLGWTIPLPYQWESQSPVNTWLIEFPSWYRTLLRDSAGDPALAKSELIISSIFDVYLLNDRILVYTKTPCTQGEMEARFILSLFPLEERGNVQETLDFQFNQGAGLTVGETCVTSRALPKLRDRAYSGWSIQTRSQRS